MWLFLNDCFLSIVSKGCARDELLVRARRKGDIEKLWPAAKVEQTKGTDYAFRAVVSRRDVGDAMVGEVQRINYANFKDSVSDDKLHGAYLRVWTAMLDVQSSRPYSFLDRLNETELPQPVNRKALAMARRIAFGDDLATTEFLQNLEQIQKKNRRRGKRGGRKLRRRGI